MKELMRKPTADGGLSEIYLPFEVQRLLSRALMWKRVEHYTIHLMTAAVLSDPCLPFLQRQMQPWAKRLEEDGYVVDDSPEAFENYVAVLSPCDPEGLYAYASQFFGKNMDPEYARYLEWLKSETDAPFEGSLPRFFFETIDLEALESALLRDGYPVNSVALIPLEAQICTESGYQLHPDNVSYSIAEYFGRIEEYDKQPFYDQAQEFFGLHTIFETKSFDDFDYDDFDFNDIELDE